jgi:hypothetical protein
MIAFGFQIGAKVECVGKIALQTRQIAQANHELGADRTAMHVDQRAAFGAHIEVDAFAGLAQLLDRMVQLSDIVGLDPAREMRQVLRVIGHRGLISRAVKDGRLPRLGQQHQPVAGRVEKALGEIQLRPQARLTDRAFQCATLGAAQPDIAGHSKDADKKRQANQSGAAHGEHRTAHHAIKDMDVGARWDQAWSGLWATAGRAASRAVVASRVAERTVAVLV